MRTSLCILLASIALAISIPASASYYYFQPLGYESTAMGGAGVASATGTMAPYYNPALLAETKRSMEFSAGVGSGLDDGGLGLPMQQWRNDHVGDALNTVNGTLSLSGPSTFSADVNNHLLSAGGILTTTPNTASMILQPSVGGGVQISRLAVGAYATSSIQATPNIDSEAVDYLFHNSNGGTSGSTDVYYSYNPLTGAESYNAYNGSGVSLGDQGITGMTYDPTLTPSNYQTNSMYNALLNDPKQTYATLMGEGIMEVPVSLAVETKFPMLGMVSIGGSAKYMEGSSTPTPVVVDMDSTGTQVENAFKDNQVKSTAFGVDAGVLFHPTFCNSLTLGAVGKNLNSPIFKDSGGNEQMQISPVYRAGANLHLSSGVDMAADYDLKSSDVTDEYGGSGVGTYRYGGAGLNIHSSSILNLRVGAMKNMADSSDNSLIYTAGVGVGLKWAEIKVAGEMAKNTYAFNGDTSPNYYRVMASLISTW